MSIKVMTWVWEHAPVKSGDLVVLLKLADNAHDDGTGAYPSQETLARLSRMTDRQVRNCLTSLEKKGLICKTGTTRSGVIIWSVLMEVAEAIADTPEKTSGRKSTSGTPGSPLPTEPSENHPPSFSSSHPAADGSDDLLEAVVVGGARSENDGAGQRHLFPVPDAVPVPVKRCPEKVDRKKVTDAEHDLAEQVMEMFNRIAGTRLTATTWKTAIIGRIREHPDLLPSDHWDVIRHFFDNPSPWWDQPAPNLIYGNAGSFERAMIPRTVRKTATEETDDMLRRMHATAGEAW